MELFKNKYRTRTFRLKSYDYSKPGFYFVTICTKNRNPLLENILHRKIVNDCWLDLPKHYKNIRLDEFIIMPDHIHGIIEITKPNNVQTYFNVEKIHESSLPKDRRKMLLFKTIGRFKMQSSKRINQINKTQSQPFWQRRFYERIIRNQNQLDNTRKYIRYNYLKHNYK